MSNDRLREILDKATALRAEKQTPSSAPAHNLDVSSFFEHHKQKKAVSNSRGAPPSEASPRSHTTESPQIQTRLLPPIPSTSTRSASSLLRSYKSGDGKQSRKALQIADASEHSPAHADTSPRPPNPHDAHITSAVSSVIDTLEGELEMCTMAGTLTPMDRWKLHEDAAKSALFIQGNSATRKVVLWAFEEFGSVIAELEGEVETLRASQSRALAEQRASASVIRSLHSKIGELEGSLHEQAKAATLQRKLDVCEMARSSLEAQLSEAHTQIAAMNRLAKTTMGEVLLLQLEREMDASARIPKRRSSSRSRSRPTSRTAAHAVREEARDDGDRADRIEARCTALEFRNMALTQEIARLKADHHKGADKEVLVSAAHRGLEQAAQADTAVYSSTVDQTTGYIKMTPRPALNVVRDVFGWEDEDCPRTCHELVPAMCEAFRNVQLRLAVETPRCDDEDEGATTP